MTSRRWSIGLALTTALLAAPTAALAAPTCADTLGIDNLRVPPRANAVFAIDRLGYGRSPCSNEGTVWELPPYSFSHWQLTAYGYVGLASQGLEPPDESGSDADDG